MNSVGISSFQIYLLCSKGQLVVGQPYINGRGWQLLGNRCLKCVCVKSNMRLSPAMWVFVDAEMHKPVLNPLRDDQYLRCAFRGNPVLAGEYPMSFDQYLKYAESTTDEMPLYLFGECSIPESCHKP